MKAGKYVFLERLFFIVKICVKFISLDSEFRNSKLTERVKAPTGN